MPTADLFHTLRDGLSHRYRLEREIASGGMARVFLAQDLQHGHPVAIKVLKPELSTLLGPRRFLNEIQVTRQLVHPYILPIYDSGSTGGLLYYVMPFLDEDSLRARLNTRGPLPVEEAIKTAGEVADALDFAHRHNVVHRDLKPENILMSAGHAVVADFGIARAIQRAGAERLTETGIILGTVAYASPEQAAGGTDLDGRSDLYSLGCILHEMLTGSPPYVSSRAEAVFGMHALGPIPDAGESRPEVPQGVRRALQRVLAKNRDERFDTGAEFSEALADRGRMKRRPWLVAAVVAAIVVGVVFLTRPPVPEPSQNRDAAAPPHALSVAVLPFRSLSGGESGDRFAAGLCEELRDRLAKVPGLRVAATSTSNQWAESPGDLGTIGRTLRVSMVMEGSVRISGERCRTSAQLINVGDGYMLWADTYERILDDSLRAQEEIADAVVTILTSTLLSPDVTGATQQPRIER